MELHPSSTARTGNIPTNAVTHGIHADKGPFSALTEVWCQQCGFRCNTQRDAKGINEFDGTTITSANDLSNGSFEDWTAGSPDSWTVSGSLTQEITDGFFEWSDDGTSSAKAVRSGSDISISQSASTPSDFNDNTLRFRIRVKSTTNRVIRLQVDVNSDTFYSDYNIGQQRFQELSLLVKCPSSVSSLTVYILADSQDGTAYIDQAILARDGNSTTASVQSGCPHCSSFAYNSRPEPLLNNNKEHSSET